MSALGDLLATALDILIWTFTAIFALAAISFGIWVLRDKLKRVALRRWHIAVTVAVLVLLLGISAGLGYMTARP